MIGQTLGPYAVLAKIGAGGMGEVYRARDTRLDRTVAIKVLPDTLAADPQFRERFQREARVISQLTHPHICTLYDVGEDAGRAYLVMELLEGETLADRLARGRPDRPALSVAEALTVATQIAEALQAAHRKGIVHRDLKPGNVMLTPSGAKLLDFGLAKAVPALVTGLTADTATAAGASETTNIRDRPITEHGTIVGTFHYMAPEQIEGREVDARTDVFAFGGVLYEMVTGRRAFVGDTPASLIAAILEREPTLVRDVQPLTPPLLDELVRRCLAKRPDDRWQSMADLASSLRWLSQSASGTLSPAAGVASATVTRRASTRWQLVATSVGALMVGAFLASSVRWTSPRPAPRVTRTTIGSADAEPSIDGTDRDIAITHDGTRVVYIGNQGTQIFVRALDSLEARAVVTLSTYARGVFISPDDQWIGYYEGASSLSKVAMSGGPSTTILPLAIASRGATWATADTIVFAGLEPAVGLQSISASGGVPRVLTRPDRSAGEADHV